LHFGLIIANLNLITADYWSKMDKAGGYPLPDEYLKLSHDIIAAIKEKEVEVSEEFVLLIVSIETFNKLMGEWKPYYFDLKIILKMVGKYYY